MISRLFTVLITVKTFRVIIEIIHMKTKKDILQIIAAN